MIPENPVEVKSCDHASAPPPGFEPGSKVPKTRVLPLHHGGMDSAGLRPCGRIHTGSWSGWRDSDPRPPRPERGALPSCATSRNPSRHGRRPWQPHWDSNPDPRIESPKCADQAHREAMIDMRMRRAGAPTRIRTGILKKSRVWAGCVYQLRHRGMSVHRHSSPCTPNVRQGGGDGSRDDRIRTCDILLPKQARCQTAPHPEMTVGFRRRVPCTGFEPATF